MKTRTADFDLAWGNRRTRKAVYSATIKRRYWNGSAYVLESSASTIHRRQIDKISGLSSKYDLPLQNRILPANVSLTMLDKSYIWLPSNTAGKWAIDGTALLGYDPVGSEVVIYYGYILDDGTEETLAMFTGVVQDDPTFDTTGGTVTFQLLERAASKLESLRAQDVCTTLTDQTTSPASGAGVVTDFLGLLKSIWEITSVRANAVLQELGDANDYTVSDLNDAETVPTIKFTAAPTGTILYNARQWYRDKSISELVTLICEAAGITAGFRSIEEPVFSAVDQSSIVSSGAEWAAGTYTNADPNSLSGTLRQKWVWLDNIAAGSIADWDILQTSFLTLASSLLKIGGSDVIEKASTKAFGTWEWKLARISGATDTLIIQFMYSGVAPGHRYGVAYHPNGTVDLVLDNGTLIHTTIAVDTTERTYRVTRTEAGLMELFIDTVSQGTYTDTTFSECAHFRVACSAVGNTLSWSMRDLYYSNEVDGSGSVSLADMVWTSPEIDLLAVPTSWLPIQVVETLNGGTLTYKTRTSSSSGGVYDAAVAVDSADTPTSTLQRYAKIVIEGVAADFVFLCPEVDSFTLRWRGTSLFIKSADFTGLSGLAAVQELAKIGGMEFGAKGDGTFYFRNRAVVGSSDITLSQKNAVLAITRYSTGYKDVRNIGAVRYGKSGTAGYYYSEYAAADSGESSPTTAERFGDKPIELELQRFIFSNDASVAASIAQKLYEDNYRPKRKITIRCRIIPQLDPGDKASLSFHDSPLIESAIFGDPLQTFPVTGENSSTIARDILMKAVGHAPDIMKGESIVDLEEVLS